VSERAAGREDSLFSCCRVGDPPMTIYPGFAIWPICIRRFSPLTRPRQFHRRSRRFANRDTARPRDASVLIAPPSTRGCSCTPPTGTLPFALTRRPAGPSARSCRMPRQPLDAHEGLMKERPGQVAFRELQREVPACRISRPPVLSNCCWRLVSDQSWIVTRRTRRCSRLPRDPRGGSRSPNFHDAPKNRRTIAAVRNVIFGSSICRSNGGG